MHKLDRSSVVEPTCLAEYSYPDQTWDDFRGSCKRTVRLALQRIQGQQIESDDADDEAEYILGLRCAYCESQIFFGGHIEHFRRKNPADFPELTFSWTNLFLACGSKDHCGHYKDNGGSPYNPDELIKPDDQDPDDYLYFHSSGHVKVRNQPQLSEAELRLAEETIRVFNLNFGELQGKRRKAAKAYIHKNTNIIEELMAWDDQQVREEYISMEIEATRWEPFATTIKHFLLKAV